MNIILSTIFGWLLIMTGISFAHWQTSQQQIKSVSVYSEISTPTIPKEKFLPLKKLLARFDKLLQKPSESCADDPECNQTAILGVKDQKPIASPLNLPIKSGKKNVTIAAIGDSIIDTMGTDLPYLHKQLEVFYPNYDFDLYNYGIGSQNILKVSSRINEKFSYKDRDYPPITDFKPDLIILGSTAYNPMELNQILEFQNLLRQTINSLHNIQPNLILFIPLAPLKKEFGVGPNGVNWPDNTAWTHATKIQAYIEAAIDIGNKEQLNMIDNYHPTLNDDGEGVAEFISKNDGIHPSISGHNYLAKRLAEYIAKHNLL